MKISDSGPTGRASGPSKKNKTQGHGDAFAEHLRVASDQVTASDLSEPSGVSGVNNILAVQEAGSAMDGRSKGLAMTYGSELLDRLEDIRRDILLGVIPKDHLVTLAQSLRGQSQRSGDQRLDEILADIEMRVEIEIAKYRR